MDVKEPAKKRQKIFFNWNEDPESDEDFYTVAPKPKPKPLPDISTTTTTTTASTMVVEAVAEATVEPSSNSEVLFPNPSTPEQRSELVCHA